VAAFVIISAMESPDCLCLFSLQSVEATKMVLELSGNKRYDGGLLGRIMQEMERRASSQSSSLSSSGKSVSGSELADSRETERLMELFGKVLQQVEVILSSSRRPRLGTSPPPQKKKKNTSWHDLCCS